MVPARHSQVKHALASQASELHGLRPPSRRLRLSCHARCAEREGHAQTRRQQRAGTQHGCALLPDAAARRPLAQLYPAAQKEGRWWLLKDILEAAHPWHAAQTKLARQPSAGCTCCAAGCASSRPWQAASRAAARRCRPPCGWSPAPLRAEAEAGETCVTVHVQRNPVQAQTLTARP